MSQELSVEATRLYRKIAKEWAIRDQAGQLLLRTAMQAFDEMGAARTVLETEGVYVHDRFKQTRLHPAAQREREARAHMLQALKSLNLDLSSLDEGPHAKT